MRSLACSSAPSIWAADPPNLSPGPPIVTTLVEAVIVATARTPMGRYGGQQQRHAGHVAVVLACLVGAAQDHVAHLAGLDLRSLADLLEHDRREVIGAHVLELAAIAPHRRARGRNNHGLHQRGHDRRPRREIWRIGCPDARSRRAREGAHLLCATERAQEATTQMGSLDAKAPSGISDRDHTVIFLRVWRGRPGPLRRTRSSRPAPPAGRTRIRVLPRKSTPGRA